MRSKKSLSVGMRAWTVYDDYIVKTVGVVLHLFTTSRAYEEEGFWTAVLTFVAPVVSEIYWLFRIAGELGTYVNPYTGFCGLFVLCWTISQIGARLLLKALSRTQRPD